MKGYRLGLCSACLLLASTAAADTAAHAARLDSLFTELKQAPNETQALRIEFDIWNEWMHSGDAETDRLMEQVRAARRQYDRREALRLLNEVIARTPDYAEAWNQRATIYFELGELEKSLYDIGETLRLEPRHFGALAGRALIRMRQGKTALAIQNIRAAMEIYPLIAERQLLPVLESGGNPY